MTALKNRFTGEQLEVAGLANEVMSAWPAGVTGDPGAAAAKFQALLESGLWSVGMTEEAGGGGATLDLRLATLMQLGTRWAALAWGCAQAHAAADLLGADPRFAPLAKEVAAGTAEVCVVDSSSTRLELVGQSLSGELARLDTVQDPARMPPHTLILTGDSQAYLLPPDALDAQERVRTTGLDQLHTIRAAVRIYPYSDEQVLHGVPVERILTELHLAGAGIAAGLAAEASRQGAGYAQSRVQFGGPLTNLPMVRAALAAQEDEAATSISAVLGADFGSATQAASALRGNCERAITVCSAALQSHGGYGYLREFPVESLLRDAISLRAATGALEASRRTAALYAPTREREAVPFFIKEGLKV